MKITRTNFDKMVDCYLNELEETIKSCNNSLYYDFFVEVDDEENVVNYWWYTSTDKNERYIDDNIYMIQQLYGFNILNEKEEYLKDWEDDEKVVDYLKDLIFLRFMETDFYNELDVN